MLSAASRCMVVGLAGGSARLSGENLQCAHDAELSGPLDLISIEGDVAISTGAYIQTTKWSGGRLHVGRVHLGDVARSGSEPPSPTIRTVGRRHLGQLVHPHPRRRQSRRSGKLRAPQWPLHAAEAHGDRLPVRLSDLATGDPQRPYADIPILLVGHVPPRSLISTTPSCPPGEARTFPANISG